MKQLRNSSEEYRGYLSEEQLWTNFKLMEVYDQMGQFVCNRYPFNSTQRKNGPSNTMSNVPMPTRPGKADTMLTFTIKDESRAGGHALPVRCRSVESGCSFPRAGVVSPRAPLRKSAKNFLQRILSRRAAGDRLFVPFDVMAMRRFGWFAGTECSGFGDLDSEESENLREISSRSGGDFSTAYAYGLMRNHVYLFFEASAQPILYISPRALAWIAAAAALINNPFSSLFHRFRCAAHRLSANLPALPCCCCRVRIIGS